jgi:hypothetical protein
MTQQNKPQTKADKRAAALRENLKKRKMLAKKKQEKQDADPSRSE